MKIALDQEDIEAIAQRVAEILRPLLSRNGRVEAEDAIFDVAALAAYLKVDESWVYKQVSLKTIPYFKTGKYTRFKKSAIDKWADERAVRPIPAFKRLKMG